MKNKKRLSASDIQEPRTRFGGQYGFIFHISFSKFIEHITLFLGKFIELYKLNLCFREPSLYYVLLGLGRFIVDFFGGSNKVGIIC